MAKVQGSLKLSYLIHRCALLIKITTFRGIIVLPHPPHHHKVSVRINDQSFIIFKCLLLANLAIPPLIKHYFVDLETDSYR